MKEDGEDMNSELAWLEIDLASIAHNAKLTKDYTLRVAKENNRLHPKLLGIVKSDAYGHGMLQIADVLAAQGFDYFGVTNLDAAAELKANFPEKNVLNLSHAHFLRYAELIDLGIEQMIASFEEASQISKIAKNIGKKAKLHMNVDTGMGRTGYLPDDKGIEEMLRTSEIDNIEIVGLMTHLSCAETEDLDFNLKQLSAFRRVVSALDKAGKRPRVIHAANSSAISRFKDDYYDMLRSGMNLYGLKPAYSGDFESADFREALSLKARIMNIRNLPAGSTIGYDATYVTKKPTKIATLNIGYYDGLIQHMKSGYEVLIRGKRAPIIGLLCLNNCMVDISHIEDAEVWDIVTFVGTDGSEKNSLVDLAAASGMFCEELCCSLGARLPKFYL